VTADVDLGALRPVLEAAVVVARAGEQARPRVPPPAPLRKFTSFTKLPDRALDAAWRALDDDEFRARVRTVVQTVIADGDDSFGPASLLVLERPDGWQDQVAALGAEARAEAEEQASAANAEQLARRLTRSEAEVARLRAAVVVQDEELDALRRLLSTAEAAAATHLRALDEANESLTTTTADRAEAVRQLQEERTRAADRDAQLRALRAELAAARDDLDQRAAAEPPVPTPTVPSPRADDVAEAEVSARDAAAARREADRLARLAASVAAAARAADELGAALREASRLVGSPEAASPVDDQPAVADVAPQRRVDDARRRPVPLPTGLFDDGIDAAWFLVRLPAAVLLVDGYNATMTAWPEQPLGVQRRMLIDGLRNLQARTGVEPVVVFDGAEPDSGPAGSLPRSVQVRFSPAGVKADDVVVDLVDRYPADRPVIVATNDREVRDGAAGRGANLLHSEQLAAMLRST